MFISTSHGKDCSVCFAIKRISYVPDSGIKIYGEDGSSICVTPGGDILAISANTTVHIECCELPTWSFLKYDGKPIGPMHEEELGEIEVRVNNSGSSAVTVQDLYHRLKRDLFSESNNRYVS